MANVVLSVLAHPDDAEFLCAGTMIRLVRERGWRAEIASLTAGDCGTIDRSAAEISGVRRGEAARAAALLGAGYTCLEERDLLIFYNEVSLEKVTRLLRTVRPQIVLTHSPHDYLLDHEVTSTLTRAAVFAAPAPNFLSDRGHPPALEQTPHLYYCDAIEGKDALGRPIEASFCIDISSARAAKTSMLACHASQREWLRKHHGMDHYIDAMHTWGQTRGEAFGLPMGEGFCQHLGHGYPQDPLLQNLLGAKA